MKSKKGRTTEPSLVRITVSESKLKRFPLKAVESARALDIQGADLRGVASLLRVKAMAPILAQIEADEKAMAAVRRSTAVFAELASITQRQSKVRSSPIGSPIQWGWSLDPGINAFGLPYNGERGGPTKGSPTSSKANRNTGEMTVQIYDADSSGTRSAEASIQLILDAKKQGILSLRPYIQFDAYSLVWGQWLSAFSRGVIFLTASKWFDPNTAKGSEAVIFSHQTQSDLHILTPNGAISASDLSLDVPIQPGEPLVVAIGVRVTGNQSGKKYKGWPFSLWSYSYFQSRLWAKLPFFVAKLS